MPSLHRESTDSLTNQYVYTVLVIPLISGQCGASDCPFHNLIVDANRK